MTRADAVLTVTTEDLHDPTTAGPGVARIVLASRPAAVRKARAFVRACCSVDGLGPSVTEAAVLLTSETVTQAVTTSRTSLTLSFFADATGGVLVEVTEPGVHRPRTEALTSFGTAVLDGLAHAWGVRRSRTATTVWFRATEASPSPWLTAT